jgi:hypothetical protein
MLDLPARLASVMTPTNNDPIPMKGFEVYAMPTWEAGWSMLFPAMIQYTGTDHFAKCYQFVVSDTRQLDLNLKLETIATLHGTFLQLTPERIKQHNMILVDDGDYVAHIDEISAISAMMKMRAGPVLNTSVVKLGKLYDLIRPVWGFRPTSNEIPSQIQSEIRKVQQALIHQEWLPGTTVPDGCLNIETFTAVEKVWTHLAKQWPAPPTFPCAPRVFQAITKGATRIRRTSSQSHDPLSDLDSDSK